MQSNELKHYGILGMRWGRRKASSSVQTQPAGNSTKAPSNGPYTKVLRKNGLVAVNRVSQMGLSFGLSRIAASVASARGKKATAGVLKAIGNTAVAGFGAAMIIDLARNDIDRGD